MTLVNTITPQVVGGYIGLPITVDPNVLIQAAFANIKAQIPGWTPHEGQLDVAIIEEACQLFAACAMVANQVPISIFTYYGSLVGIEPIVGAFATVPVQFTMFDEAGYTIPAGTVVAYPLSGNQQILFTLQASVTIASGDTTGTGALICETVGSFANALPIAQCFLVTTFAQVARIETTALSTGGVDAETQAAYLNRLATELQLLAPRPILPADFAAMATNVTGVYRALAINGLNPGRTVTDGITTSGSLVIGSATGFTSTDVGRGATGTALPAGATIAEVLTPTTAQLATGFAATSTTTDASLTFSDLTNQERCVTVSGLDVDGNALTPTVNAAMLSYLEGLREVNFIVSTVYPTFTEINVDVTCFATTGTNTTALQSSIIAALTAYFNPATFGGGNNQVPQWQNTGTISFIEVAQAIASVPGVLYIPSGDLTIAVHGGSFTSSDLRLPGDAPMPFAGSFVVTVLPSP